MQWFGPTWGAPCCDPAAQVPTPVGEKCLACNGTIHDMDQGFLIPALADETETYWHLNCFLRNIGVRK